MQSNDEQFVGDVIVSCHFSNSVDPLITPFESGLDGTDAFQDSPFPEPHACSELACSLTDFDLPDGGGLLPADGVADNQDDLLNENHSQVSFGCLGICSGDCIDAGGFAGKSFSKVH